MIYVSITAIVFSLASVTFNLLAARSLRRNRRAQVRAYSEYVRLKEHE